MNAHALPMLAEVEDAIDDETTLARPRTRGECVNGPRPCPWVSCSMHLAIDVRSDGTMREVFPGRELDELDETCALDVADRHPDGVSLSEIGDMLNVTRERIRQIEGEALTKLARLERLRTPAAAPGGMGEALHPAAPRPAGTKRRRARR